MKPAAHDLVERVDAELATFLDGRAQALAALGDDLTAMSETARRCVLDGGKRLRPRFAYWGWRAVRSADADDHGLITSAASLELLHACALVHDDVMDASQTRRGRAAAHSSFAQLHRTAGWPGDPAVFGAAAAILLGDLLLSWADSMFAGARLDPACAAATRRVFDEMRQLVMAGQYLDVLVQARAQFSAADALRVAKFKTSKYTVEGPLHLGAAVGGAPPAVYSVLSGYGLPLGEAFQLRDDVLGVYGDPGVTGKPAGDDLREGKRTLLVALAMQRSTPAQAALLSRELGDRMLDAARVGALRELIVTTGALDEVEARIAARAGQARDALRDTAISEECRDALEGLSAAATERHN